MILQFDCVLNLVQLSNTSYHLFLLYFKSCNIPVYPRKRKRQLLIFFENFNWFLNSFK